ncbi:MAG: lysylphosphatidylglycerol synthase transmembrane domain-containing protein [Candidatus Entotheonellia bacterium]
MKQGHIWIGIGISLALVVYLFSKVDYSQLWRSLASADGTLLGLAGLLLATTFAIRSWRWQYLLRPLRQVRFSSLMAATSIGLMANMIFPARLGELVRALVLGRRERMEASASFATIIVERLIDGFTILLMLAALLLTASLPLGKSWEQALRWGGLITLTGYLGVFALLYYLHRSTAHALDGVQRLGRRLPGHWVDNLSGILISFSEGLQTFSQRKYLGQIIISSVILWAAIGLFNFLVVLAFKLQLPLTVGFLLLVFQAFAVMIPSSPGFVGTYHAASVACLSLWGVSPEVALSVALVMHAITFLLTVGMGLGYLWSVGATLRDFTQSKITAPPSSSPL